MKQTISSFLNFECVNSEIGEKTILELSSKNRFGVDGLSINLLKRIAKIITSPLCVIINQSLITVIFPDRLKIDKVFHFSRNEMRWSYVWQLQVNIIALIHPESRRKILFIRVYD